MASKKWLTLPGGRTKRWKKSRTEDRPGWGSSRFPNQVSTPAENVPEAAVENVPPAGGVSR
jgi:hypothetical protein